ncbi:MAG: hypothetical protein KAS23_16010 [Anaerohalosphaera sp.]|nr:hypothetical protein [Anaerohalosphaera sp.]
MTNYTTIIISNIGRVGIEESAKVIYFSAFRGLFYVKMIDLHYSEQLSKDNMLQAG